MFSLNTIKCIASVCENLEKNYNWSGIYNHRSSNVIAVGNLRFSILTSYKSTQPPLSSVPHMLICLF